MKQDIAMRYQGVINMAERLYQESNKTQLYDDCIKEAEESYDRHKPKTELKDIIIKIMDYIFMSVIFSSASFGSLLIIGLLLFSYSQHGVVFCAILGLLTGIPLTYYIIEKCDSTLFGI